MIRRALLSLIGLCIATASPAAEILHWEHLPLPVSLIVGEERVIILDSPVRAGVPASLEGLLRVQSADGAVYLDAEAPFRRSQLELQDLNSGELILLELTARRAAPHQPVLQPIRIIENPNASNTDGEIRSSQASAASESRQIAAETPLAVALTRYAAQSLYAPLRTVEPVPGIDEVPIPTHLTLDTLLPTLPVRARLLAAWRLRSQYVTAVKLTNTSSRWVALDPRLIQGNFVAATFEHPDVGPAGRSTDTTVLYLVTRGHGIAASLLPKVGRFDAALDLSKRAGDRHQRQRGHQP
jgi:integrating conjugative element protein (TIGR03749 family)